MKLNILIPMAGLGSRFSSVGYNIPKPLIDVYGKPMIQRVVENLEVDAQYIFIVQHEHCQKYNLVKFLNSIVDSPIIFEINGVTDGAASTTLFAKDVINNKTPLIIANSDQIVEWQIEEFISMIAKNSNAIALFKDTDPKWSYAEISDGKIKSVAEKQVISDNASVGIYGWSKGSDYVKYAEKMIAKNIRVNNEFYICPVYNEAIADGQLVLPYFVDRMHGIGTPEDLDKYLEHVYGV